MSDKDTMRPVSEIISKIVPPFKTFKKPFCRGSYVLGSACGHCERCAWERSLGRDNAHIPVDVDALAVDGVPKNAAMAQQADRFAEALTDLCKRHGMMIWTATITMPIIATPVTDDEVFHYEADRPTVGHSVIIRRVLGEP